MSRLRDLAARLPGRRVAVVGDVMLDHFLIGRAERMSPEAPVPVVRYDREEHRLGGAANVAHNISALGAEARLVGLVGDDAPASELRRELMTCGVDGSGLVTAPRPTTRKVRIVTTRHHQVARIDYEEDRDVTGAPLAALELQVGAASRGADAIVLSDYRKGVVTPPVIQAAATAAHGTAIPLVIDPKVPQPERYRGATLITPNHHEAELMTALPIRTSDDARRAARVIHERSGANVVITLGEHGMWLLEATAGHLDEEALPAAAREVSDVTGAGDTVAALLALSLAAGAPLAAAARLANLAAGLVVARFGPAVVTIDELLSALGRAGE
jgi:D-beta-D-heptose 7-phosphate kinase/D-beta-D-heptose 1-phosphate adenosyltransferase